MLILEPRFLSNGNNLIRYRKIITQLGILNCAPDVTEGLNEIDFLVTLPFIGNLSVCGLYDYDTFQFQTGNNVSKLSLWFSSYCLVSKCLSFY